MVLRSNPRGIRLEVRQGGYCKNPVERLLWLESWGNCGSGEMWSDYVWKIEPLEFADRLSVG